jgi:hypothetical protein
MAPKPPTTLGTPGKAGAPLDIPGYSPEPSGPQSNQNGRTRRRVACSKA